MRGLIATVAAEGLLIGLGVVTGKTIAWVLVGVCALVLVVEGLRKIQEWHRPRRPQSNSHDDDVPRRVGYLGRGSQSKADLARATFGDKLDTAIDNEGEVDASEADFQ